MAFISYAVAELSDPLKIEDSVIAYAELQLGMQRNTRYMQSIERVRLGLQTSPENFFYGDDRLHWRALRQPERSGIHCPGW